MRHTRLYTCGTVDGVLSAETTLVRLGVRYVYKRWNPQFIERQRSWRSQGESSGKVGLLNCDSGGHASQVWSDELDRPATFGYNFATTLVLVSLLRPEFSNSTLWRIYPYSALV